MFKPDSHFILVPWWLSLNFMLFKLTQTLFSSGEIQFLIPSIMTMVPEGQLKVVSELEDTYLCFSDYVRMVIPS